MAFQDGENNKSRYNSSYTAEEAEVVDRAKHTHRETTASAQRALKASPFPLLKYTSTHPKQPRGVNLGL